jgi:hypothetical protein
MLWRNSRITIGLAFMVSLALHLCALTVVPLRVGGDVASAERLMDLAIALPQPEPLPHEPKPDPLPEPRPEPEPPLGINAPLPPSLTWLGFADPEPQVAPPAPNDQAAFVDEPPAAAPLNPAAPNDASPTDTAHPSDSAEVAAGSREVSPTQAAAQTPIAPTPEPNVDHPDRADAQPEHSSSDGTDTSHAALGKQKPPDDSAAAAGKPRDDSAGADDEHRDGTPDPPMQLTAAPGDPIPAEPGLDIFAQVMQVAMKRLAASERTSSVDALLGEDDQFLQLPPQSQPQRSNPTANASGTSAEEAAAAKPPTPPANAGAAAKDRPQNKAIAAQPINGADEPGIPADKQSSAASALSVQRDQWQLGKPLAGKGLELKPRRPTFTLLTMLTAAPGNPLCEMRFDSSGKVQLARIVESSGDSRVDEAILNSLYDWRASGEELAHLNPGQTYTITMRMVLTRR